MSDETARVTLAYPYDGYAPDDTIELPAVEARTLIADGKAREPDKGARLATKPTRATTTEEQ